MIDRVTPIDRPPAIQTHGLGKLYEGGTRALADVALAVPEGAVFGLLGQNGAGKTTLIRILLDMIRPTEGSAALAGFDSQREPVEARRHVGYLPSSPRFYSHMTSAQIFSLAADLRAVPLDPMYLKELEDRLDLNPDRIIQTLSRGNQQKVGLIVEEQVLEIVREVATEGRTVFFSSHVLTEVEDLCDRAAVLRSGQLVGVYDLAAERRLAARQVTATFDQLPAPEAFRLLPDGIRILKRDGHRVTFALVGEIDQLIKELAAHHVTDIEAHAPTLEDSFFALYRSPEPGTDSRQTQAVA